MRVSLQALRLPARRARSWWAAAAVGAALLLAGAGHGVGPPAPPQDCGDPAAVVPDFSLVDQNPGSPGYGRTWTRADLMGRVTVVYWATAT